MPEHDKFPPLGGKANSGHFNLEINIPALIELSKEKTRSCDPVEEYIFKDGRHIRLLAGRNMKKP